MIQLLKHLSRTPMSRSVQADALFTGWFCIEAIVMLYLLLRRITIDGLAGYADLAVLMVVLYGFTIPGVLYLLYSAVIFGFKWTQRSGCAAAWVETFTPRWAVRSSISFGCALLVNTLYVFALI